MFSANIEDITLKNSFYRKVIHTTDKMQLVIMSLNVGENIHQEVHENVDQFFRIEKGCAKFITPDKVIHACDGDVIIIPEGTQHEVQNIGKTQLKLYTIYTPPNHPPNTIEEKQQPEETQKEIYETKTKKYTKKYAKLMKLLNL